LKNIYLQSMPIDGKRRPEDESAWREQTMRHRGDTREAHAHLRWLD
jgi:hypothetical protein